MHCILEYAVKNVFECCFIGITSKSKLSLSFSFTSCALLACTLKAQTHRLSFVHLAFLTSQQFLK